MWQKWWKALACANTSARTVYGDSPLRFIKYAYVSLFSLNTFIVFCVDGASYVPPIEPLERLEEWPLERLHAYRQNKTLPKQFYADTLNGFRRPWVYTENDDVAYIFWVCEPSDTSSFLHLNPGDVEMSHAITMPQFRRRGIHERGTVQLIKKLARQGYSHIYSVVHNGNSNGLSAFQASGMQPVGKVYALGPFRFRKNTRGMRPAKDTE